ncbi:MAG: galactokinase family protein, partial [Calditrichaeota bacterium]|nr:galactokinase family protein [Calditrichota bacterium]
MSQSGFVIVRAPGRMCLFGEHQDYLGLPVIAAAIDRYIEMRARRNGGDRFRIEMPDIDAFREIHTEDRFPVLEKRDY